MQSVILAAGHGTRMEELTGSVPKPMLEVAGKSLLEYKLAALPDSVDEVIIVVGYLGNVIREHFGGAYNTKRIVYVEQKELNGTAGALWLAKDILKNRFLVMAGDDIYASEDIRQCIEPSNGWKVLLQQVAEMHRSGFVELNENAHVIGIIEGDHGEKSGLANTHMFAVDTRLFSQPLIPKMPNSLEFGLPQTLIAASGALGIPLEPVFTDKWIQITSPKDLVKAAEMLKKTKK